MEGGLEGRLEMGSAQREGWSESRVGRIVGAKHSWAVAKTDVKVRSAEWGGGDGFGILYFVLRFLMR